MHGSALLNADCIKQVQDHRMLLRKNLTRSLRPIASALRKTLKASEASGRLQCVRGAAQAMESVETSKTGSHAQSGLRRLEVGCLFVSSGCDYIFV